MASKKREPKKTRCPKGAIVAETITDEGKRKDPHFVAFFDRPGRIEVSCTRNGVLVMHCYDGTKIDMHQSPVGGFMLDPKKLIEERWISKKSGEDGVVDHNFNSEA